jgi:hypothetical protein
MKLIRFALAVAVLGSVAGLAYVAQQIEGAGAAQVTAAQDFLASLTPEQKQQATYAFDDKERFNWYFVPRQDNNRKSIRKGVPLEAMNAEQTKRALALLRAGTSVMGAATAEEIMSLEAILREAERKKDGKEGNNVRSPQWYFFTIFGTPSKSGQWGWRVEGHHLAINVTLNGTQVLAASPWVFGANPAELKSGPKKGHKVLGPAQDLATQLFTSLSDDQKKVALQAKAFPEPGQAEKSPKVGAPVGVAMADMTDGQKATLVKLIEHYADRMPKDVGAAELKAAKDAGLEKVHFAYTGSTEDGKGRTYRVQGPTFVIEFLNMQADSLGNVNNHIHSGWRRIKGDFGLN